MENANNAIFIGVYTTLFVIALSLTIFLYSSMMSYSEDVYEYLHSGTENGVLTNVPVNRHLIINGEEVISYYYNYLKKDKYTDNSYDTKATVIINLNTRNESEKILTDTSLSYKELVERVGINTKYILTVQDSTTNTNTTIRITKATEEELQEEW